MLFDSINKIKKEVDESVRIYPTHGSGSLCGRNIGEGNYSILKKQIENSYAFKIENEEEFVVKILKDIPKAPSYFVYNAKVNQNGENIGFDGRLK
jgi:poly-D-alanine transfer protein DltD